jgi:hypothetical protein
VLQKKAFSPVENGGQHEIHASHIATIALVPGLVSSTDALARFHFLLGCRQLICQPGLV